MSFLPESQITPLVAGYRSFIENLRDPLQSEYPAGQQAVENFAGSGARLCSPRRSRVVLVPDRSLHSLNFETLPDPEDPSKYLIERTMLEVAPSLDMLAGRRPPPLHGRFAAADRRIRSRPSKSIRACRSRAAEIESISKAVSPGKADGA